MFKILVVEDDRDLNHTVCALLNRSGYEATGSGVETLHTDFISNVSHEMKTPLAVMQNYGTLLQAADLPEDKRIEYAKGITDSSRRLVDMMTNTLKLNKLENQQIFAPFRITKSQQSPWLRKNTLSRYCILMNCSF